MTEVSGRDKCCLGAVGADSAHKPCPQGPMAAGGWRRRGPRVSLGYGQELAQAVGASCSIISVLTAHWQILENLQVDDNKGINFRKKTYNRKCGLWKMVGLKKLNSKTIVVV